MTSTDGGDPQEPVELSGTTTPLTPGDRDLRRRPRRGQRVDDRHDRQRPGRRLQAAAHRPGRQRRHRGGLRQRGRRRGSHRAEARSPAPGRPRSPTSPLCGSWSGRAVFAGGTEAVVQHLRLGRHLVELVAEAHRLGVHQRPRLRQRPRHEPGGRRLAGHHPRRARPVQGRRRLPRLRHRQAQRRTAVRPRSAPARTTGSRSRSSPTAARLPGRSTWSSTRAAPPDRWSPARR